MENDVLYNRIMNVVHGEYGSGSTAVANPEGEPTDDLTSIQIGGEIYGISGGGGGFFEVHDDDGTLDKTWKEIDDAMRAGKQPFITYIVEEDGYTNVTRFNCSYSIYDPYEEAYQYKVFFYYAAILEDQTRYIDGVLYVANSANGYPAIED